MAADANILQQYLQAPKSVIDYQNEYDERDARKTKNAIQALALQQQTDQTQQGLMERNALRRIASTWTPQTSAADRIASLRSSGLPGLMQQADTLETQDLTRRKTDAEITDKGADTASKQFKLSQEKRQAALQRLVAFQSPADAMADLNRSVQNGEISMQEAQAHAQRIPQDPAQFGQWQLATLRGLMSPEQAFNASKPVLGTRDNGGAIDNTAIDPITGRVTVLATTKKQQSPDNVATTGLGYARLRQDDSHFQAGLTQPQYMQTDAGLVALPKKPAPGVAPTATVITGPNGESLGKPLKDIPPTVNTAIITNAQNLARAKQALQLLDGQSVGEMTGDKAATGVKGYLPQGVLNRVDPKGVDTRAMISDLGSMVLHERSGAAVTAAESPRLMPFIPLATDDAATVKKKLQRFVQVFEQEQQALGDTYSKDQGYKPSPVKSGKPTGTTPGTTPSGATASNW